MITDIVVQLEDGSIANVEIQKIGYTFPGQRVGIGLLQEYLFVSLDIFKEKQHNKPIRNRLVHPSEEYPMRRFIYILYIFAIIPVILGLCGCTNKPKELSEEALTTYLEKKYNDTFTLKDCKKFSPHKGTDTLYTFESGSGIICHISKVYSGGFMGYTYSYQEDYPTMYLRKYPAPAIRNITFRDETVIDCVVYRKENSEYVIDQSCKEYKGCPFYPDKLATPLRTLGWSIKLSKRSIIWSKDADEVELCLKRYGMNHMQLHCFKNGKEYSMRGRLLWQSGTNPIVTMSESDLKYLFGMEFQFDQVHLTGELILNAS